jgi:hypothetical protein
MGERPDADASSWAEETSHWSLPARIHSDIGAYGLSTATLTPEPSGFPDALLIQSLPFNYPPTRRPVTENEGAASQPGQDAGSYAEPERTSITSSGPDGGVALDDQPLPDPPRRACGGARNMLALTNTLS